MPSVSLSYRYLDQLPSQIQGLRRRGLATDQGYQTTSLHSEMNTQRTGPTSDAATPRLCILAGILCDRF